jgi:hypothetical protein
MLNAQSRFEGVVPGPEIEAFSETRQYVERRGAPRREFSAAGLLTCVGLTQPIPCKVVDFSGFGARLKFNPSVTERALEAIRMPQKMRLTIVAERSEAECTIVWRCGDEMGVRLKYTPRERHRA